MCIFFFNRFSIIMYKHNCYISYICTNSYSYTVRPCHLPAFLSGFRRYRRSVFLSGEVLFYPSSFSILVLDEVWLWWAPPHHRVPLDFWLKLHFSGFPLACDIPFKFLSPYLIEFCFVHLIVMMLFPLLELMYIDLDFLILPFLC